MISINYIGKSNPLEIKLHEVSPLRQVLLNFHVQDLNHHGPILVSMEDIPTTLQFDGKYQANFDFATEKKGVVKRLWQIKDSRTTLPQQLVDSINLYFTDKDFNIINFNVDYILNMNISL